MSSPSPYSIAYSTPAPPAASSTAPLNWPAIVSLATALAGAVTVILLSMPICVFAIVMGHVGLRHATRIGVGRGQAIGGLVVGYIAAIANIVFFATTAANALYSLGQLSQYIDTLPY